MRVFRYRAIRVMHEIQGGSSMIGVIGVDTPLIRSL